MGLAAEECYTKKISLCVSKLTQGAARFVLIGADVVPADRIEEKKQEGGETVILFLWPVAIPFFPRLIISYGIAVELMKLKAPRRRPLPTVSLC